MRSNASSVAREALQGLNVLIPRASVARDYLPKALEEAGARVDVVPAYRTALPARSRSRTRGRDAFRQRGLHRVYEFLNSQKSRPAFRHSGLERRAGRRCHRLYRRCHGDDCGETLGCKWKFSRNNLLFRRSRARSPIIFLRRQLTKMILSDICNLTPCLESGLVRLAREGTSALSKRADFRSLVSKLMLTEPRTCRTE